jgi:hypothetical protein
MPRWLWPALALSLAVLLAVAQPVLFPPGNPRITKASYDRIQLGMRLEDVRSILGPPGDYRTGPTALFGAPCFMEAAPRRLSGPWVEAFEKLTELRWEGDEAEIAVSIDPAGEVVRRDFTPVRLRPGSPVDRFLWRWERWRKPASP